MAEPKGSRRSRLHTHGRIAYSPLWRSGLKSLATRPLAARLFHTEIIMSKPTQGGKNGGNSSLQEAKGSKSSSGGAAPAGNSGGGKGNSQSTGSGNKDSKSGNRSK